MPAREGPRWNKFVAIDDREGDTRVVMRGQTSEIGSGLQVTGSTPLLQQTKSRFTSLVVPFGIAAAFFGPATEIVRRRVRVSASTNAPFVVFADTYEEPWRLFAELVTADEVRELEYLWALPYPGAFEGDFRLED